MSDLLASQHEAAARCACEILRRRLQRSPLPTPNSQIDDGLSADFSKEFLPFVAVMIPIQKPHGLKVGVLLSHLFSADIDITLIGRLERLARRFDLNSLILPTIREVQSGVIDAASNIPHVRVIKLQARRSQGEFSVEDFQFIKGFDQNTINEMNIVVEEIVKNLGKVSHILLSDVAASSYDKGYKSQSAGTAFVMQREEELLGELLGNLNRKRGLIELGCGTGRHSLMLSPIFERVFGYDFSSKMIDIANAKKAARSARSRSGGGAAETNVEFIQRDVEMYPLELGSIPTPVDCVLGLFGMGSFVEDLPRSLQNTYSLLEGEGRVAFSFYNREAFTYTSPPPWRHTSLSATLDTRRESLQVTLPNGQSFFIYCRSYAVDEIRAAFGLYFDDVRIRSFPTISGLLPPEYIGRADKKSLLQKVMFEADRALGEDRESYFGNYFFVTGRKPPLSLSTLFAKAEDGQFAPDWYESYLAKLGYHCVAKSHVPTRQAVDIATAVGIDAPYCKAILSFQSVSDRRGPRPVVFVLPASARLDRNKALTALGAREGDWRLAGTAEVAAIFGSSGFPLPFLGMTGEVRTIVDRNVALEGPIWTSGGSASVSLLVSNPELVASTIERADLVR